MSRIRLYVPRPLAPGQTIALPREQAHYLGRVMRLAAGAALTLFNGEGGECAAELLACDGREAKCRIVAFENVDREAPLAMHVIQAACRADKIETVLQKGTELGAASFQIARTRRATLRLDGARLERRLERWRAIVIEAAEQSGRTRVPPVAWRESLEEVRLHGTSLLLHPHEAEPWPTARERLAGAGEVDILVGPEGGFTEDEVERLRARGCTPVAFGPRIMRTETAAPALLAAIQAIV